MIETAEGHALLGFLQAAGERGDQAVAVFLRQLRSILSARAARLTLPDVASETISGQWNEDGGTLTYPVVREGRELGKLTLCWEDGPPAVSGQQELIQGALNLLALLLEREAEQREWERFFRGSVHDLRSVVTRVVHLGRLLSKNEGGAADPYTLELMESEAQSADELFHGIQAYVNAARLQGDRVWLRTEELAADLRWTLRSELRERNVAVMDSPGSPPVQGYERSLKAAVEHVVRNSIEANATTVKISAEPSGDGIVLRITDDGSGIDPVYLERVFEPFFRLNSDDRGHGLGLPTARRLVRAHCGRMWLAPAEPKGLTAALWLPNSGAV